MKKWMISINFTLPRGNPWRARIPRCGGAIIDPVNPRGTSRYDWCRLLKTTWLEHTNHIYPPQLISPDYQILHRTMHDMYMQRLYEMKPTQYHNTFPEWHRQNNVNHKIITDEHAWGPLNEMAGTDHTQCAGDMDQGRPKRLESQLPRFL